MTTSIQNKINELLLDGELQETHNVLMGNYNDLLSASYSEDEAKELVLSENDALDSGEVEQDTQLWLDVRDIQNEMIRELPANVQELQNEQ